MRARTGCHIDGRHGSQEIDAVDRKSRDRATCFGREIDGKPAILQR